MCDTEWLCNITVHWCCMVCICMSMEIDSFKSFLIFWYSLSHLRKKKSRWNLEKVAYVLLFTMFEVILKMGCFSMQDDKRSFFREVKQLFGRCLTTSKPRPVHHEMKSSIFRPQDCKSFDVPFRNCGNLTGPQKLHLQHSHFLLRSTKKLHHNSFSEKRQSYRTSITANNNEIVISNLLVISLKQSASHI